MQRKAFIRVLVWVAGLGPGFLTACARLSGRAGQRAPGHDGDAGSTMGSGMMGMMGSATHGDMRTYMDMFAHHTQIRRAVHEVSGGIRTVTESDNPRITSLLQVHVASMYKHLDERAEVICMSSTLPTMFRNAGRYRRQLRLTPKGVEVTETSADARLAEVIRRHAREVSGFVNEGMPAMMRGMMQ